MKTKSGRVLSAAEVERLAAQAERGFDLTGWKPRRGRPPLDPGATTHAPRIAARVSAALYERATARAASEGRTISEVVRELLEAYAPEPGRTRRQKRAARALGAQSFDSGLTDVSVRHDDYLADDLGRRRS